MNEAAEQAYRPRSLALDSQERKPILREITVVIPTLGRPILEESLYWLLAGTYWPGGLVVVDQGRNPKVQQWVSGIKTLGIDARYLPSEQRGRAAGVNRGLEAADTPFVALTDDDCFVDSAWLFGLVKHLRQEPISVVTGRVEAAGEGVVFTVTLRQHSKQTRPRLTFDQLSGGNMATSKTVLDKVGMFDENATLRTAEDGEWAYRALRKRIPIYYNPEISVRHYGWRTSDVRYEQYASYARSQGGFYGKHLRQGDLFILLRAIVHLLRSLRRWLVMTFRGDKELAEISRAYCLGLIPGMIAEMRRVERQ